MCTEHISMTLFIASKYFKINSINTRNIIYSLLTLHIKHLSSNTSKKAQIILQNFLTIEEELDESLQVITKKKQKQLTPLVVVSLVEIKCKFALFKEKFKKQVKLTQNFWIIDDTIDETLIKQVFSVKN